MRPPLVAIALLCALSWNAPVRCAPASARSLDCAWVAGEDDLFHLLCEERIADGGRGDAWRIPMWSAAPYPDADYAGLVRAVLCARNAPCEVRVNASLPAADAPATAVVRRPRYAR